MAKIRKLSAEERVALDFHFKLTNKRQRGIEKSSKRQAFKVVKSSSAKAAGSHNGTHCPLLSLPYEIRVKIWTELIPDKRVYIKPEDLTAKTEFSEMAWVNYASSQKLVPKGDFVHMYSCNNFEALCFRSDCHLPDGPWIPILRTCRQAYLEINPILWTSTTFCFMDGTSVRHFIDNRTIHQKRLLQKMELALMGEIDVVPWCRFIPASLIKTLSGLRTLKIRIDTKLLTRLAPVDNEPIRGHWVGGRPYSWSDTDELENWGKLFKGIKRLEVLELEEVAVAFWFPAWRQRTNSTPEPSRKNMRWQQLLKRALRKSVDSTNNA